MTLFFMHNRIRIQTRIQEFRDILNNKDFLDYLWTFLYHFILITLSCAFVQVVPSGVECKRIKAGIPSNASRELLWYDLNG